MALRNRATVLHTSAVSDLGTFAEGADVYDSGWRGRLHHSIADEVAALALEVAPSSKRILDVGCGMGYLDASAAGRNRDPRLGQRSEISPDDSAHGQR